MKKRGRKPLTINETFVTQYLNRETPSLKTLAQSAGCTPQAIGARLNRSLYSYLVTAHQAYLKELRQLATRQVSLVAVVDALWHHLEQREWTTYLVLLKPINEQRAFILEPAILQGHECLTGWQGTLQHIPRDIIGLIQGIVCDGGGSLNQALTRYSWVKQRCHFHLLSQLQNYATTGARSADAVFSRYLMQQAQIVLRTRQPIQLNQAISNVRNIQTQTTSRGIRRVLRGLLHDLSDFRAYLDYPELNLPTTTNAAESTVQIVRDLLYRARGFRTHASYTRWITARLYGQKYVACRGNFPQK